ncbi:MAG: DUF4385 domain-containing protein [Proteobacteria bacterium]|nr:MAG: DUF4385 domain-containing protein [Pseudomonadota bacterium]
MKKQVPRRLTHAKKLAFEKRSKLETNDRAFNYQLNYKTLNLRENPLLYRVGRSEQGVLLVEPYKSEILPHWKFKTPEDAKVSSQAILKLFEAYKKNEDFIGMDMARKFLQMGYTRSRRYANHASGQKYAPDGSLLPFKNDDVKAASAEVFRKAWWEAETDEAYVLLKAIWQNAFG